MSDIQLLRLYLKCAIIVGINEDIAINSINSPKKHYRDSFLWFTIALPSVVLIAFNIHFSFSPSSYTFPLLPIALLILWLFIATICSFFFMWNGLQKKTMSFVLSFICLWPTSMVLGWFPIADYVHLAVAYPEYKKAIASSPKSRLEFDWGTFGLIGGANRKLVFDPSDKLPQENKIKDAELRKKTCVNSGDACWALTTKQLTGHFYIVTEWH